MSRPLRPRVLFLSQRFLLPMDTGGKIRTGKLLERLKTHWSVTIVGNYEAGRDAPYLERMQALGERYVAVPWVELRRGSPRWYASILRKTLSSYPITVLNDTSAALSAAVRRELDTGSYDLFVCDFLQSTLNVPPVRPCPTVLFTHNVESRIARRYLEQARGLVARAFWRRQLRLMERYEGKSAWGYDRVVAVSDSDREEFESAFGLESVRTIPTGIDTEQFRSSGSPWAVGSIVFCGSMDWLPNQDGVRWFVKSVLPRVRATVPDARLTVVGRLPPPAFVSEIGRVPGVEFTGWVEDVRPFVDRAACYVVPLRIGGGTRIKIYEALAMEKPLVSTTVGAEGLPVEHERHFLRADDADEFARAVARCLCDPAAGRAMGRAARNHVRSRFNWERVAEAFAAIGEEAMHEHKRVTS